jgi:hypothetical protein
MTKDMKHVNTPVAATFTHNMDMDLDGGASAALGGVNLNNKLNEEQHEQSPEEKGHERNPDVEDHSSDEDVSLMNLEN